MFINKYDAAKIYKLFHWNKTYPLILTTLFSKISKQTVLLFNIRINGDW